MAQVSAIPITPRRVRDRSQHGYSASSTPHQDRRTPAASPVLRWEDIQRQRPISQDDLVLPEDQLEDLMSLPIAPELRGRRSKTSVMTLETASSSSAAFPTQQQQKQQADNVPQHDHVNFDTHHRKDSLRRRARSSPMLAGSPSPSTSNLPLPTPDSRPDDLRRTISSSTTTSNSSNKRAKTSAPAASPSPSGSLSAKTRSKVATTSHVQQATLASSSARKQANVNGTSTGSTPRKPLGLSTPGSTNRLASTPVKRTASGNGPTSPKPSTTRTRSTSASFLNRSSHYEWDENSKPPWLDESPSYLYKSDIEATSPGSLAHLAQRAQGRLDTSPARDPADASFTAADTSVKNWDDVILPAVAKQIRAQQMLEAQKRAASGASTADAAGDGRDENMLVTDWNTDGTPKKWRRVPSKRKNTGVGNLENAASYPTMQPSEAPASGAGFGQPQDYSVPSLPGNQTTTTLSPDSTRHNDDREYQNPSSSSHQLATEQPLHPPSIPSQPNSIRTHSTGRREIWQEPALHSPNTARQHGFGDAQGSGGGMQAALSVGFGLQPDSLRRANGPEKRKSNKEKSEEDSHGGGCCKCIIM